VWRLASLLWRLRRIIAIETDLLIQAEILHGRRKQAATGHGEFTNQTQNAVMRGEDDRLSCSDPSLSARELTYCFLRLGNLDSGAFERLGRYNARTPRPAFPKFESYRTGLSSFGSRCG
jgi:hypothetical protein